ncbi:hypothetical protein RD792_016259 [Penstemon davidsonii]|uniref:Pentatricopeptide repeat-containing protein-mitochondrial domain-containing protein n=1 Tax=Penstemon davidsonii TaxID=160366 RepID=A0ABR0CIU4_9LAMI|nr:hypothetical protein RD792_016259 [Penstemon davidsonii]
MRHLFKGGFLNSNACNTFVNSHFHFPRVVQLVYFSILSNNPSSNLLQNSKNLKNHREIQGSGPLFSEILSILGTEDIVVDKNDPYGFLISKETKLKGSVKFAEPSESVCENANEKIKVENLPILANNEKGAMHDRIELKDVSPIVHQITKIVRGENGMEERLEKADFYYNEGVVEKVIKRCFKVPHLALRFFNWVKSREGFGHTVNTFNTMIHVAAEAKESGLVERLVEEMEKSSCEKNVKTWTLLVSCYGKAKIIGKALSMFEEMKKASIEPDAIAYRIMLQALCKARKSDIALEFYKEMLHNEVAIDEKLFKKLLNCFALCGDVDSVHLVGDNMISISGIPEPSVYCLMLKSFCIGGLIQDALELIRGMKNKNIDLDSEAFETLVKGLCSTDRIEDAMEIVEIMKKRNVFARNIYGVLINAYLRRNKASDAINLFQEVKNSGDVSVSIYTNLMQYFFLKNEFPKGIELYYDMIERGIELDSVAIIAVAVGYIRQNRILEAWKVFKSMNEKGITETGKEYTIFINEISKIPKTDEIVKVLNEMLTYLEKKGETKKLESIKLIQRAYKEESNCNQSDQIKPFGEIESDQVEKIRSSHNQDVREVCQILSSSKGWYFIQRKLENCYFQFTPELVVETLRNSRLNNGMALKFFSWIGKQSGYSHNAESYNMAMKIAGQGKDFKHMRSLFYEMKRRDCLITSDTWTIMIMQYGRTGLTDMALNKFKEMKSSGFKPNKSTYNFLITSLCGKKGRKVEEAIQIYQEMVQLHIPDKETIEIYIGCLCEVDKLLDARSCIESLNKFGFSVPLAYSIYFRALCRVGKLDHALALMDEVGHDNNDKNTLDLYTYGSLIHCLLQKGRLEEALEKIESMKRVGVNPTVHVYTSLIVHFFKEKKIDKALEKLEEMKENGIEPTIVTYSAVICGYVRMGKVTDAWNVFYDLKRKGLAPDFKTYSMFIDCLCKIDKSEEALKLVSEMVDCGIVPSTVNFRKIVYGLNREGKQDLAMDVLKKKWDLKQRRQMTQIRLVQVWDQPSIHQTSDFDQQSGSGSEVITTVINALEVINAEEEGKYSRVYSVQSQQPFCRKGPVLEDVTTGNLSTGRCSKP